MIGNGSHVQPDEDLTERECGLAGDECEGDVTRAACGHYVCEKHLGRGPICDECAHPNRLEPLDWSKLDPCKGLAAETAHALVTHGLRVQRTVKEIEADYPSFEHDFRVAQGE